MIGEVVTLESINTGRGKHKSFVSLSKDTQLTLELAVNSNLILEAATLASIQFGFIAEHTSSSDFQRMKEPRTKLLVLKDLLLITRT